MSELALMVAIGNNGAIGKNGDLPWNYPDDRAHFESTTKGHVVIMGKRTFEEAGPPFGLRSIVVSKTLLLPNPKPANVWQVGSLDEALKLAWSMDPRPFVIGGAPLFLEALPKVTHIYLTEVPDAPDADTFFNLDRRGFTVVAEKTFPNGLKFVNLERAG
jgi:dihydrofolate reductase